MCWPPHNIPTVGSTWSPPERREDSRVILRVRSPCCAIRKKRYETYSQLRDKQHFKSFSQKPHVKLLGMMLSYHSQTVTHQQFEQVYSSVYMSIHTSLNTRINILSLPSGDRANDVNNQWGREITPPAWQGRRKYFQFIVDAGTLPLLPEYTTSNPMTGKRRNLLWLKLKK